MNFWKTLGNTLLNAALQGAAGAAQNGGGAKDIGITAGINALGSLLNLLLTHSATTSPVVTKTVAEIAPKA